MAFDRRELVTIAAAVVVTTDPAADRGVMFAFIHRTFLSYNLKTLLFHYKRP